MDNQVFDSLVDDDEVIVHQVVIPVEEVKPNPFNDMFEDEEEVSDFMSDLRSFMDVESQKDFNIDVRNEHFTIETKDQANYFIKRILDAREKRAEIERLANEEIARTVTHVNEWKEKQSAPFNNQESHFLTLLQQFAEKEIKPDAKTKSIKLPYGSIGFKKQQPEFVYNDEALLAFLEGTPEFKEYVSYKAAPKKAELKTAGKIIDNKLTLNEIVIPGIAITPRSDKFEVK